MSWSKIYCIHTIHTPGLFIYSRYLALDRCFPTMPFWQRGSLASHPLPLYWKSHLIVLFCIHSYVLQLNKLLLICFQSVSLVLYSWLPSQVVTHPILYIQYWFSKSLVQVTFETLICHWLCRDVSTKPHSSTPHAFVQLYLRSLVVIFLRTLLLTVHKLRQSALACNQCVMLLLALPINIQAENLSHSLRLQPGRWQIPCQMSDWSKERGRQSQKVKDIWLMRKQCRRRWSTLPPVTQAPQKPGSNGVVFHLCGATQPGKLGVVLWEE